MHRFLYLLAIIILMASPFTAYGAANRGPPAEVPTLDQAISPCVA